MEEKIEKLDMIYGSKISSILPDRMNDMIILSEKVNEIIDYLNSQDQEEEITIPTEGLSEEVRENLKRTDEILQETRYGNQFYQQRRNL